MSHDNAAWQNHNENVMELTEDMPRWLTRPRRTP